MERRPVDEDMDDPLRWAASCFAVDQVTAEVTSAFSEQSVDSILLKGPTIATWLYTEGDRPRLYADTDLLIRRDDWSRAHAILKELGFEDSLGPLAHPRMESGEGHPWIRGSQKLRPEVDLHFTLFGLEAGPEAVWSAFRADATEEPIGGRLVRMPSRAARLMHIALHVVQHGDGLLKRPMADLERALSTASRSDWEAARDLAETLGGSATFSAGLLLLPEGRGLAGEIGVGAETSVASALRLGDVPMSEGFAELTDAPGLRAKLSVLVREMFPNPGFMRWWSSLARRGRIGLALSYPMRLTWLAYRAIPGFLAWRRAMRAAAKGS